MIQGMFFVPEGWTLLNFGSLFANLMKWWYLFVYIMSVCLSQSLGIGMFVSELKHLCCFFIFKETLGVAEGFCDCETFINNKFMGLLITESSTHPPQKYLNLDLWMLHKYVWSSVTIKTQDQTYIKKIFDYELHFSVKRRSNPKICYCHLLMFYALLLL